MSYPKRLAVAATAIGCLALAGSALAQTVSVSVNLTDPSRHLINPSIYGTSYGSVAQLTELRTRFVRMGGNNTTRYNWQANADNRARDWYFESIPAESGSPAAGEMADTFIANARTAGAEPTITVPIIGWIAKVGPNREKLASFSVKKYGRQTDVDRWFRDAGNGVTRRNGNIVGNDPNDANVQNSSDTQSGWVSHLIGKWGSAANGGLRYYTLDNEHSIWQETHRDVQPTGATGDELLNGPLGTTPYQVGYGLIDYVRAIKTADSGALTIGPEEWGWSGFELSGYDQQDGKANGWTRPMHDERTHCPFDQPWTGSDPNANEQCWYIPWMLRELAAEELRTNSKPLLDVLSVHWYPQGGENSNDTTTSTQLMRNRSTRVLWDPNYTDPTWIASNVQLIPRLRRWANAYHQDETKIAITEYNWGAEGHINGATSQADIWGIFGRYGLDIGARWVMPDSTTPTYKAMKLFRNYDGQGGAFGEISVPADAPNPDELSTFAAVRNADHALTVVVINKVTSTRTVTLSLGFTPSGNASVWRLTSTNSLSTSPVSTVTPSGTSLTLDAPAQSISMVVVPGAPTVSVP